jgi:hypothetical protein
VNALLTFGEGGTAVPYLVSGWAPPEPGFTWTIDTGATLIAPIPDGPGELFLELTLNPYNPPNQRARALRITANGQTIGAESYEGLDTIAFALPSGITGPTAEIGLHHESGPSPAALGLSTDSRALGFMLSGLRLYRRPYRPLADVTVLPPIPLPPDSTGRLHAIRARTGLTPRQLAEQFESLGRNCEFGLFQRHFEAEPLGLLRFAAITLDDLVHGLDDAFADLGAEIAIERFPIGKNRFEFLVKDNRYHLTLHSTRTTDDDTTEADIAEQYRTHLPFLGRHLRGRLAEGSHIHVFQRPGQLTYSQAVPVWNRLQSYGPNALLYVDQDPALPCGAVEQRGHGLYHGKLATMAPHTDAGQLDQGAWLSLCANAYHLWTRSFLGRPA